MENKKSDNGEEAMREWKQVFCIGIGEGLTDKIIRSQGRNYANMWEIVQAEERPSGKALKPEGTWSGVSTGESLRAAVELALRLEGAVACRPGVAPSGVPWSDCQTSFFVRRPGVEEGPARSLLRNAGKTAEMDRAQGRDWLSLFSLSSAF